MPVFQLSWFELSNTLTLLIVLVIINRLYSAIRILNSRVEILSSLVKNLKRELNELTENQDAELELQDYINEELALSEKLRRDFSYGKKKPSRFSGSDLTRSGVHSSVTDPPPSVTDPPPPKTSRFKRIIPPNNQVNEEVPEEVAPPVESADAFHDGAPKGLASLHTLSSSGMDGVIHANATPPTPSIPSNDPEPMTVQDGIALNPDLPNGLDQAKTAGKGPASPDAMTLTDLTQRKLGPVNPDSIETTVVPALQAEDYVSTTSVPSLDAEETVRGDQSALSVPPTPTKQDEEEPSPTKRLSGTFDLTRDKPATPSPNQETQRSLKPVALDDLFSDMNTVGTAVSPPPQDPSVSTETTAVSPPPESPSQEDLLARYHVQEEGAELRIKKDLSYLSKAQTTPKGKRPTSFSREQIPSLSLLRDQGDLPEDIQALVDDKSTPNK